MNTKGLLGFATSCQRLVLGKPSVRRSCTSAMSLRELRVNYSNEGLHEDALPLSPFPLFSTWMSEAREAKQPEPNAMCLSTSTANGRPSARMVLLKGFDDKGFVWYTNYESRKAKDLSECPFAALTFWWADLERSVRVEGVVRKVSTAESDEYFASRPPSSRLGAWASDQSRDVSGRDVLQKRWESLRETHLTQGGDLARGISRPEHWGGYRLVPDKIEFWKGRESRLHDRILYERELPRLDDSGSQKEVKDEWRRRRLQP